MRLGAMTRLTILATAAVMLCILLTACSTTAPAPSTVTKSADKPAAAQPATEKPTSEEAAVAKKALDKTAAEKAGTIDQAAPKPTSKPAKLTIPVELVGASMWPLYVMQEKGFAKEENLEIELPVMKTDQIAAALAAKSIDIALFAGENVVRMAETGENPVMVGGVTVQATHSLVTAPAIKSVDQLKGKKIAVNTLEGGTTAVLRRMLASKGLQKGDYDLVVAGGTNERWAALKAGGVEGAMLVQPVDLQATQEGYNAIMFAGDAVKDWLLAMVDIRKDWPKAKPDNEDVMVRFLRALSKADRWLNDPKNKPEAVQILAKITKADEQISSQTYDIFARYGCFPKEAEVPLDGVKVTLDIMNELGGVFKGPLPPPEKYIDMTYWEKATGKKYIGGD